MTYKSQEGDRLRVTGFASPIHEFDLLPGEDFKSDSPNLRLRQFVYRGLRGVAVTSSDRGDTLVEFGCGSRVLIPDEELSLISPLEALAEAAEGAQ